jgi:hypothetical protein
VHSRLRPDYVRRWIANPKKILPYTSMPVNIPFDPNSPHLGGVDQAIYPGTSIQQLDALVDLLMNYPTYTSQQNDIGELVKEGSVVEPAATSGAQAEPARKPSDPAENATLPANAARVENGIQIR